MTSDQEEEAQHIYIVDDEPAVRDALGMIFRLEGFETREFSNAADFLSVARDAVPACVLLDVHMPGKSGLDVLREIDAIHYPAPIFIISGKGDIPTAVKAIKDGALDFIEKPFDADMVVRRVQEAIDATERRTAEDRPGVQFLEAGQVTRREYEVLVQITNGASNKEAARQLGISPRTVEVHRARIMEKLGAKNAADLVRIVLGG